MAARIHFLVPCLLAVAWIEARVAQAVTVTGADWLVHFNLPDQNSSFGEVGVGEFEIRNALVARLNALQTGHVGTLATYTFSGSNLTTGAAGAILGAIEGALNRGATVRFVVDGGVVLTQQNGTNTLSALAARPVNPLVLVQDDSSFGIMHDKLGLFDYGPTNRWVFIASWNFTGGASTFQWNIALEARNDALYAAYSNEFAELLAGRFHDHSAKSHAHDKTAFTLPGAWTNGFVRFAPFPSDTIGGDQAQTDITNAIAGAEQEIVFALNKLTRPLIVTQLVNAANRGVSIHGVMPQSDTGPGDDSSAMYTLLTNAASYTTTNVVHLLAAYSNAAHTGFDSGQVDLVHAKFMVIDPFGARPWLIHGSANWTDSALSSTNSNDENLIFAPHAEIARSFYACFKQITGVFTNRADFWVHVNPGSGVNVDLWTTDADAFTLDQSTNLLAAWTNWQPAVTGLIGRVRFTNDSDTALRLFRAHRGTN
jgi:phosphatidylserine/phosphatidylglycerophosphate/cardiolipin synthase-like enzyme